MSVRETYNLTRGESVVVLISVAVFAFTWLAGTVLIAAACEVWIGVNAYIAWSLTIGLQILALTAVIALCERGLSRQS